MAGTERDQLQDNRSFWWACVDIAVLRDPALPMSAKAIYAVLCTYASTDGKRVCFPSVGLLAESAGCSERTVQRALDELVQAGYVQRQERYKDNSQITSLYSIVGHRRPEKAADEQGGVTNCHPGGVKLSPRTKPENPINNTATQGDERPEINNEVEKCISSVQKPPLFIPAKVPQAMIPTIEYLLLKTGRTGINGEEIGPIMALEKSHMPARIQKEISTAADRFMRKRRPLSELTFIYIFEAMKYQKPTKVFRDKNEAPATEKIPEKTEEELEYERYMAERFGGG